MELVKLMGGVVSLWQDTYLQACDADDDEKFGHSGLIFAGFFRARWTFNWFGSSSLQSVQRLLLGNWARIQAVLYLKPGSSLTKKRNRPFGIRYALKPRARVVKGVEN